MSRLSAITLPPMIKAKPMARQPLSLRQKLRLEGRFLVLGAVSGLATALIWLLLWHTPVFEGEMQLIEVGPAAESFGSVNLHAETARLRAPAVLAEVANRLDTSSLSRATPPIIARLQRFDLLDPTEPLSRAAAIESLSNALSIAVDPQSGVMTLRLTGSDPIQLATTLNVLAEIYFEQSQAQARLLTDARLTWLSGRVEELRQTLEHNEVLAQAARATQVYQNPTVLSEIERKLNALRLAAANPDKPTADRLALLVGAEALTSQIDMASEELIRARQLDRESAASEVLYTHYLARLQATALEGAAPLPRMHVLSPAGPSLAPVSIGAEVILPMGGMLGFLLAAAIAMLRPDHPARLTAPDQIKAASGLALLAMIPLMHSSRAGRITQILRSSDPVVANALRDLRASILLTDLDHPPRVIMVGSPGAGDGRTMLTLMLAEAMSNWGKRVLVIEADLATPSMGRRLGHPGKPGLLSVLSGIAKPADAATAMDGLPFDILVAEKSSPSAPDIFASDRFTKFIADMRRSYDLILIDTPPLMTSADARMVAPLSDGVVMVARHGVTRGGPLRKAVDRLDHPGIRLLGSVFMAVPRARARRA